MHPEPADRTALFHAAADAVRGGGHLLVLGLDLAGLDAEGGAQPDPERRFTPSRLAGAFPGIDLIRLETVTQEVGSGAAGARSIDTLAWGTRRPG